MTAKTVTALVAATIALAFALPAHAVNPPGVDPDHYQCYRPTEKVDFKPLDVRLRDQFGLASVKVVGVLLICAPVSKNAEPVEDKRTHFVCYSIRGGNNPGKAVRTRNQFGDLGFKVGQSIILCVPSLKQVVR